MVFETKSWRLCHELTEEGRAVWQQMLEDEGTAILWRHEHPVRSAVQTTIEWLQSLRD